MIKSCRWASRSLILVLLALAAIAQEQDGQGDQETDVSLEHPGVAISFESTPLVFRRQMELTLRTVGILRGHKYRVEVQLLDRLKHRIAEHVVVEHAFDEDSGDRVVIHLQQPQPPIDDTLLHFRIGVWLQQGLIARIDCSLRPQQLEDREQTELVAGDAGKDSRNVCLVDGECWSGESQGVSNPLVRHDDSDFAYRHWNVGKNSAACLSRARQWHLFCKNPTTSPITATFVPTADQETFPSPGGGTNSTMDGQSPFDWVILLHATDGYLDFLENFLQHYTQIETWSIKHAVKVVVSSRAAKQYIRATYQE